MKGRKEPAKGKGNSYKDTFGNDDWFKELIPLDTLDNLPIMRAIKGQSERVQMPIHNSTMIIATQIKEQNPEKFRITLDVLRSMLYAGRQVFDWCYLKHSKDTKECKTYRLAKLMEELDTTIYDSVFVDEMLKKLLEGHVSHGQGVYSRDSILAKIEEMKPLLSEDLAERCDIFIAEELDSEAAKRRVEDRIRQRNYRKAKKNLKLVPSNNF